MELVWYACYGSNMDLNRFMKYIKGGCLPNRVDPYLPCPTDIKSPRKKEKYIINRRFYFAKGSKTWSTKDANGNIIKKHGVGFISNKLNIKNRTYARLYLISKDQFRHLFEQENARDTPCTINYAEIKKNKKQDFNYLRTGNEWFYGRIIQLERYYKGYPILTFTAQKEFPKNKPMPAYVKLISAGIKKTHKVSNAEIAAYMRKAKQ